MIAFRIIGRFDPRPLAAIDHDEGGSPGRGLRRAAAARLGEIRRRFAELIGSEIPIVRQVVPRLPRGGAELAREVDALDMIRRFGTLAAVMFGDQRRQCKRRALACGGAIGYGLHPPPGECGVEPGGALRLPAYPEVPE